VLYAVAGGSWKAAADGLISGGILLAAAPMLGYDCARCVRLGRVPRLKFSGNVERRSKPTAFWALVLLRGLLAAILAALGVLCLVMGFGAG